MLVTIQMGSHVYAQGELVAVAEGGMVEIRDGYRFLRGRLVPKMDRPKPDPRAHMAEEPA